MPHPSSHLTLVAAVGIAALASAGCPAPLADLGPYTTRAAGDSDEGASTAAAPLTTGDAASTTAPATLTTTTGGDDDATTTDSTSTTAVSASDGTSTGTIETSDTHDTTTTGSRECGPDDPLHPFPAPFLALGGNEAHGSCTLTDVSKPAGKPDELLVNLFCRGDPINIHILEGPLPEMTALKSQQIDVDINLESSELGPERHWVVLSRDNQLIYASVRGHTLLGVGVEGDAYAPFAFDTAPSRCDLAPTASDWPPADPQGFACELAAPIFLGVRVNNSPELLLKAGFTLEAPVVGGKYRLEVRAATRGNNCLPGFPQGTDVDTYSFAVASQPD